MSVSKGAISVPPLGAARLYGIVDLGYVTAQQAGDVAHQMIIGGVDVLQLRAKGVTPDAQLTVALALRAVTASASVPLIINDHPELAHRVDADGVHLGQDDGAIDAARALAKESDRAGRRVIVGRSTHSLAQATAAQLEGADYLGFGPLYPTPTKAGRPAIGLKEIARVEEMSRIPVFCIGGIDLHNLQAVLDAGARRVVIVSAILRAADIAGYCRAVKAALLARPL